MSQPASSQGEWKFVDSLLEEEGFEPVVPLQRGQPCAELGPSFFGTRLRPAAIVFLDATLPPFQLLVAVTLVGFDLARQRNVSIEGQVGYRNEMRYRCISAADIQAAENASLVPTINNINDIALPRNWNIRRLLC